MIVYDAYNVDAIVGAWYLHETLGLPTMRYDEWLIATNLTPTQYLYVLGVAPTIIKKDIKSYYKEVKYLEAFSTTGESIIRHAGGLDLMESKTDWVFHLGLSQIAEWVRTKTNGRDEDIAIRKYLVKHTYGKTVEVFDTLRTQLLSGGEVCNTCHDAVILTNQPHYKIDNISACVDCVKSSLKAYSA